MKLFFYKFVTFFPMSLFAMDIINISGKVVSESGEELIGANVSVLGGSSGTATDASGNYRFDMMRREVANPFFLKASYIGYQSVIDLSLIHI